MKIGLFQLSCIFLLGVFASSIMAYDGIPSNLPYGRSSEKISPHDRIKESQIFAYDDRVVIDVKGASLAKYADTNSMDPLLDEGSNGIEVIPKIEDDLRVGDVVSYETDIGFIVHRIIAIENDESGKYFVLKGDNNQVEDPYKVRFSDIKYVLVGIIY